MGNPGCEINLTGFQSINNPAKISRGGVATAQQGEFTAMKLGIIEGNIALKEADKQQASSMSGIGKGGVHGLRIPGGVKNSRGEIIPKQFVQRRPWVILSMETDYLRPALLAKLQPLCAHIQHQYLRSCQQGKLRDRQTNWTCSHDQHTFSLLQLPA